MTNNYHREKQIVYLKVHNTQNEKSFPQSQSPVIYESPLKLLTPIPDSESEKVILIGGWGSWGHPWQYYFDSAVQNKWFHAEVSQ